MKRQSSLLFLAYTTIIFGTMYLSGKVSELSLYDRFIIDFHGAILSYKDYNKSVNFYSDILNFTPIKSKDKKSIVGFKISKYNKFYLKKEKTPQKSSKSTIIVRVRNGFKELHSELIVRSEKPIQKANKNNYLSLDIKGAITQIVKRKWGEEFVAYDYNGNKIVFLKTKNRNTYRR